MKSNVICLYDVRPEWLLAKLKRLTGLRFAEAPQNLAELIQQPATSSKLNLTLKKIQ